MTKFRSIIIVFLVIQLSSCVERSEYILIENFDNNTRGWLEEYSDYHSLKIDSGFYYIHSKDTTRKTAYSSVGSLDKSYLYALPDEYEIETKIKLISKSINDVNYGLLLYGGGIEYRISVHISGEVDLYAYDYNTNLEQCLLTNALSYPLEDNPVSIKLTFSYESFTLFVNNYAVGSGELQVKAWQSLRLFTSNQSKIAVDYLTIREITLNDAVNRK